VVLPTLSNRDKVFEAHRSWLTAGDQRRGWYFVDLRAPASVRFGDAEFRYQKAVTKRIRDSYQIVGRILPEPHMLVSGGKALNGLGVEPLGILRGDQLFVDLEVIDERGESPFIGEQDLMRIADIRVPDDAAPAQVVEALYAALKVGAEMTWRSLFTTWHAVRDSAGLRFDPLWSMSVASLQAEWVRARTVMQEKVFDARVVGTSEIYLLAEKDELPTLPRIEEIEVEIDHIGRFDDEWRSFWEMGLRRIWHLQRLDGGPWRISFARDRGGV